MLLFSPRSRRRAGAPDAITLSANRVRRGVAAVEPLEARRLFCLMPHGTFADPVAVAPSQRLPEAPRVAPQTVSAQAAAAADPAAIQAEFQTAGYVPMAPTSQLAWATGYFTPAGTVNLQQGSPAAPAPGAAVTTYPVVPVNAAGLPLLQSRPDGAGLELFLDFSFENGYYHPFSTDADRQNYNAFEQRDIFNAWREVASAFSFLDVNVTTVLPYNNHNFAWIAITNEFVWGGEGGQPGIGQGRGAFAHHTFALEGRTPGLIHELGHNLGMWHNADYDFHGNKTQEYTNSYDGRNRSFMGGAFWGTGSKYRFHWARTSEGPWATQDQIASALYWISTTVGGDGFRPDDYGNSAATALDLGNGAAALRRDGYLERPSDNDVFRVTPATSGPWHFSANPLWLSTARPVIRLEDAAGKVLAIDDDAGAGGNHFGAAFTAGLEAGRTYYVRATWDGDYSSLGYYNLAASPLPAHFTTVTIGDPVQPGNAAWDPATNTFTHVAGGGDTWQKWDQEQFTHAILSGDGSITARIDGVDHTGGWAKAGVEIRQSALRDSPRVYLGRIPGGQLEEIARRAYDTDAVNPNPSPGAGPWVRIVRSGNLFTYSHSANGTTWNFGGTVTVNMTGPVMIGVTSSANSHRLVGAATVSNVAVVGDISPPTPTPNTLPPPPNFTAVPAAGQTTDVTLSWGAAAGAAGYVIERSADGVDYEVVSSVPATFTGVRDSGTTYAKRWFYRISSTGPGNTRSAPSAPVDVTNKPAAPGMTWGYTTPDVIWSDDEIFINWLDTHGETGYRIDVSTDGVDYRFDRNVPANSTAANFAGLLPGRPYWFRVTPTSPRGDGVPRVITSQTRLGAVDNLRLTGRSPTSTGIAWDDAGTEDGYRVEWSTDGVEWTFRGDAPRDVTTWTENNLTAGAEYYYRVAPWNGVGRGDWRTVMAATPAASVPGGWAVRDVGVVAGPGAALATGAGAWKLVSGGGDVFGNADAFHFAYKPIVGDATIVARVESVERTHDAAKAGVMIRQDLTPTSRSAALTLNAGGGWGLDFRSRTTTGAGTAYQQVRPDVTAPYWLKLARTGGTVTASYSTDGVSFTSAATVNLALGGTIYVGLANTSSSTTLLNTSTFSNVAVQGRPPASVQGRWAFYNGSALDGNDPALNADDDAAVAVEKVALRPGGAATFENVTGYTRGINGIMIDLAGLPVGATPSASDFVLEARSGPSWAPVAAGAFARRQRAGDPGIDRITLALPDSTASNTWLRVTVKANANTGLASPDVFYFGNLPGDTGGRGAPTVDAADLARTRGSVGRTAAAALAACDFNRDGVINPADVLIVRTNLRRSLPLFTAPAAPAAVTSAGTLGDAPIIVPPTRTTRPPRRGVLDEPAAAILA